MKYKCSYDEYNENLFFEKTKDLLLHKYGYLSKSSPKIKKEFDFHITKELVEELQAFIGKYPRKDAKIASDSKLENKTIGDIVDIKKNDLVVVLPEAKNRLPENSEEYKYRYDIVRRVVCIKGDDVFLEIPSREGGKFEPGHKFDDRCDRYGWWLNKTFLTLQDKRKIKDPKLPNHLHDIAIGDRIQPKTGLVNTFKNYVGYGYDATQEHRILHYNPSSGDFFVSCKDASTNAGHFGISEKGLWVSSEYFTKFIEERKDEQKQDQNSMNTNKTTSSDSSKPNAAIEKVTWNGKQIRIYNTTMPALVDFAKTAFVWLLRKGLEEAGTKVKMIGHWAAIVEDFLTEHVEEANAMFQWLIGFASCHLNKIRQIPGLGELEFLNILDNPELRSFGEYAKVDAEGDVLGTLIKRVMDWVKTKVFGSSVPQRIVEVMQDPAKMARFVKEATSELSKEHAALREAQSIAENANAQAPAVMAASAA